MIIKEVITLAKYSELSGVAAKDKVDAVVAFINLGMIEIYTKFPIKVEEHVVSLRSDTVYYDMPSNFMYATGAYGEAEECAENQLVPLPINDESSPYSIFFNNWSTLQVPTPVDGAFISIIYAAKPTPITVEQAEDGITELDLPDTLVDALLSYIGYRGHLGVKSDSQSENNAHWARFERNCKKAHDLGVAFPGETMNMDSRINTRGFV